MKRLNDEQIRVIRRMTLEGASLRTISHALKLKKTTVYYHFKKIRGRTYEQARIRFSNDKEQGEVLGIFAGDGSYCFFKKRYYHFVRIHLGREDYADYVKRLFEKVFNKAFYVSREGRRVIVQTRSRKIADYLQTELSFEAKKKAPTIKLRSEEHSDAFWEGFLKGLVDTDGTISKRGRVTIYTTSREMARQCSNALTRLKFDNAVYPGKLRKGGNYPLQQVTLTANASNEFIKNIRPQKSKR